MNTAIFLTHNLTNEKAKFTSRIYFEELLKEIQPQKNLKIINLDDETKSETKQNKETFYEHEINTIYAKKIQTQEELKRELKKTILKQKNEETRLITPNTKHENLLDNEFNEFLKRNNIKKTLIITIILRDLLDKITKQEKLNYENIVYELLDLTFFEQKAIKTASEYICYSSYLKKTLQTRYKNETKNKLIIISGQGINKRFWQYKPRTNRKIWAYIGPLNNEQNLEPILMDIKQKKKQQEKPIIIGEGELEEDIKKLKKDEKIKHTKPLNDEDTRQILAKIKYYIHPSKTEFWPINLYRAMAMGKICIVDKNSHSKEKIKHGENGFLIDFEKESILEYIEKLENNKIDFEKITINARKTIKDTTIHAKDIKKLIQ